MRDFISFHHSLFGPSVIFIFFQLPDVLAISLAL